MTRSWQDNGEPFWTCEYDALTPVHGWDGERHYWSGFSVDGMETQGMADSGPNCCPPLSIFKKVRQETPLKKRQELRARIAASGICHDELSAKIGISRFQLRQRLYGSTRFVDGEVEALERALKS